MAYDNFNQLRDDIFSDKLKDDDIIVSLTLYQKLSAMQVTDPHNKPNKIWGKTFKLEGSHE